MRLLRQLCKQNRKTEQTSKLRQCSEAKAEETKNLPIEISIESIEAHKSDAYNVYFVCLHIHFSTVLFFVSCGYQFRRLSNLQIRTSVVAKERVQRGT